MAGAITSGLHDKHPAAPGYSAAASLYSDAIW